MKSAVETLDATTVKLTVEVSYDELKPSIEHAYEHIGSEVSIPGFRKGKVPPRILEQRVGRPSIIEHAVNDGLPTFYRDAITEANLRPLGQPDIEVTEIPALTGTEGGLTFTAQVEVRPDLTLPDLSTLTVTVDDVEVTDEDVQGRLDSLRERYQGVAPPAARTEADFDPGAKYHVAANVPYTRYFLATFYQFQFHKALCDAAGWKGPLHACSVYGSKEAGAKLERMLEMGASRPWPEAYAALTGKTRADASALLEYFAPLRASA